MSEASKVSLTKFVLDRPNAPIKEILEQATAAGLKLTSSYVYKIRVRAGLGKRAAKTAGAPAKAAPAAKKASKKAAKKAAPKARGTKKNAKAAAPAATPAAAPAPAASAAPKAKKPGRPKKVRDAKAKAAAKPVSVAPVAAPKKRGRPKKVVAATVAVPSAAAGAAATLRRIVIELGVAQTRAIVDDVAAKLQAILAG
jgi:hypothetical protein